MYVSDSNCGMCRCICSAGAYAVQVEVQMHEHVQVHRHVPVHVHVHVPSLYSVFESRYVLLGGSGLVELKSIMVELLQFHLAY